MTTYNGSIANLYIDSELKAYSDRQTCQIKYGDDPFVIGVGYGGGNSFFCGLADNAIIYDRAITDSEVLQHYANPPHHHNSLSPPFLHPFGFAEKL